jgi:hypothetical protein
VAVHDEHSPFIPRYRAGNVHITFGSATFRQLTLLLRGLPEETRSTLQAPIQNQVQALIRQATPTTLSPILIPDHRVTPHHSLPLLRHRRVFPQVLHIQTSPRGTMAILLTGYFRSTLRRRTSLTRIGQRAGKETRKGSLSLYVIRSCLESAPLTWCKFSDRSFLCHGGGVHQREL